MASDSSARRSALAEDRALQRVRLGAFLRWTLPSAIAFDVLFFVAGARLGNPALLLAGVDVLCFIVVLLVARRWLARGALEATAELIASGLFVICLVAAPILPWMRPALLLIPLVAITLVFPDLDGVRLRRLLLLGFVAEAAIVSLATWMPPWLTPPPAGLQSALVVGAVTVCVGLIFLLLYLDAKRLRRSIATADFHALKVQAVVERAPIVIFALDRSGRFTLSEGRGLESFGLRPGEVVGASAGSLYPELEWLQSGIARVLAGTQTSATGKHGDRNLEVHLRPLDDGGAIGIGLDVTERERALEGLRLLSDASRVLGEPSEELRDVLERVARVAVHQFATECTIDLVDDDGQLHPTASARRSTPDLEPRSTISAALLPEDGRPLGVLMVSSSERHFGVEDSRLAEDLAARAAAAVAARRLYDDAQRAVRVRDEFLSVASHELKTPLTTLRLETTALDRAAERGDLGRVRAKAAGLQRHVERVNALVDELLDVGRLRAGRISLHLTETNLAAVVTAAVARMEPALERAGCAVVIEAVGDASGFWDASRLDQVVTNLLSNAAKYAPGKPIVVWIRDEGDAVVLSVEDRGIGISTADQQRIFRRFERAVSERNYGGLGLGLFIVHELVSAHGGTVAVQSAPGEGAVFKVRLPRRTRVSRAS